MECYKPQTSGHVGLSQVIALIGKAPGHNSGGNHQLPQCLAHNCEHCKCLKNSHLEYVSSEVKATPLKVVQNLKMKVLSID